MTNRKSGCTSRSRHTLSGTHQPHLHHQSRGSSKELQRAEGTQCSRSRTRALLCAYLPGSDYTAFLQHVGVPSMNLGFGGEGEAGVYHSVYDDFYWYTHFSDSSFVYGRA